MSLCFYLGVDLKVPGGQGLQSCGAPTACRLLLLRTALPLPPPPLLLTGLVRFINLSVKWARSAAGYHNPCPAPASIIIEELNIQPFRTVMLLSRPFVPLSAGRARAGISSATPGSGEPCEGTCQLPARVLVLMRLGVGRVGHPAQVPGFPPKRLVPWFSGPLFSGAAGSLVKWTVGSQERLTLQWWPLPSATADAFYRGPAADLGSPTLARSPCVLVQLTCGEPRQLISPLSARRPLSSGHQLCTLLMVHPPLFICAYSPGARCSTYCTDNLPEGVNLGQCGSSEFWGWKTEFSNCILMGLLSHLVPVRTAHPHFARPHLNPAQAPSTGL
ncbi:unnamed protein product [Arctogadus glacialis]